MVCSTHVYGLVSWLLQEWYRTQQSWLSMGCFFILHCALSFIPDSCIHAITHVLCLHDDTVSTLCSRTCNHSTISKWLCTVLSSKCCFYSPACNVLHQLCRYRKSRWKSTYDVTFSTHCSFGWVFTSILHNRYHSSLAIQPQQLQLRIFSEEDSDKKF